MKKSYVIVVLIIVVLLAGGIWWAQQNDNSNTNTPTTSTTETQNRTNEPGEEVVVLYDGSGFSPNEVTVNAGDTVVFRNESTSQVWPASDAHPTHNELSGFDALQGLTQGEEYSFTFEEVGTWGYHNHLNSVQTGTVIVE